MTTATRPKRTWQQWAGLGIFLVVGFVIWATVHDKQQPSTPLSHLVSAPPSQAPDQPTANSAPALSAEDAAKQNDKGWVLETYTAGGSGTINARIKNANGETSTAFFTMTLLNAGSVVATWHGSATGVQSGVVVSVTMLTADAVPAGVRADDMQFQTDTSVATG